MARTVQSGCMLFVPGSHKKRLVPHVDTFSDNNLLSPGQASLHHGHLFHSSGLNRTSDRRIGAAIRFIKPSMKQTTGDKTLVTLVSGVDRHNHFKAVGSPQGRLTDDDFALCRADAEIKRKVLYEGVDVPKGKRY